MAIYPTLFVTYLTTHVPLVFKRGIAVDGRHRRNRRVRDFEYCRGESSLDDIFVDVLCSFWRRLWPIVLLAPFKFGALAERRDQTNDFRAWTC